MRRFGVWEAGWCLWAWLVGCGFGHAADVDQPCKDLFRSQSYAAAGACFGRHIPKALIGVTPRQRVVIGRRMRNASLSYQRAAAKEKDTGKKAYYREQAVALLRRYLKHKLFESKHRKASAIMRLHSLQERLFYAPLTVLTKHPKAAIKIEGFRLKIEATSRWVGRLRPGSYRLVVRYPGVAKPSLRALSVTEKKPMVVIFSQPRALASKRSTPQRLTPVRPVIAPKSPGASIAGWSLLGVGLAALVAAGATFGVAQVRAEEARAINPFESVEMSRRADGLIAESGTLATTSLIFVSVGGAMALSGGLLLLFARSSRAKAAPKTPASPPKQRVWSLRWEP